MQKKMTYSEFIDSCQCRGIKISKISRNFVYADMTQDLTQTCVIATLSNCRNDIYDGPIYPTIYLYDYFNGSKITLDTAIRKNMMIKAITILRERFNLSLKQARDLYDSNIEAWKKEVDVINPYSQFNKD
jgi:hypothetical protein